MTEVVSADVCVVGGGAAGSTVADALAATGFTVVVLERGPRRRGARRGRGDAFESTGLPIGSPERVSRFGLGGDGLVWGRAAVEFDPIDVEARPWRPGWPLPMAELADAYVAARKRLGVPPGRSVEDSGEIVDLKPIDRSPVDFGGGPRGARVLLETRAVDIVMKGRRVHEIEAVSPRGAMAIRAQHYVLAAGGLATPALLLASGVGSSPLVGRYFADHPYLTIPIELPAGAPPPDGIHGGTLMAPPQALFMLSESERRDRDLPGAAAAFMATRSPAIWDRPSVRQWQRIAWGWHFREISPRPLMSGIRALAGAPMAARAWMDRRNGNDRVSLRVVAEPVPTVDSRVIATIGTDGHPVPRVDWRLQGPERESVLLLLESLSGRAEEEGWGPLTFGEVAWPDAVEAGAHHMGATRMGSDADTGAVDPDCRVFGTDNLYVAGPAVFPTYSYANPMLTIVALAIRLARHLEQRV